MPHEPEPTAARSTRQARTVRLLRRLLFALLLGALLAACGSGPAPTPDPDPDPPPPPSPRLTAPATMHGQTSATVQVLAAGAWQLQVLQAPGGPSEITSRVELSRASGTGNANVTLTVDPTGLDHVPYYPFRLQLQAGGRTLTADVEFTFPFITGYALQVEADAQDLAESGDRAGGPGIVIQAQGAGPDHAAPAGEDLAQSAPDDSPVHELATAPEVGATPSEAGERLTLIVGLEPADRGLASAGLAGTPAPAALSALSVSVGSIPGAALASRFDEAGLVLVEVPAANAAAALDQLAATRGVRYVEQPVPIYPFSNDQFRHLQWNLDTVQAEQLWPVSDGSGVTIAVLDNGFYPRHPDLNGNLVGQYDAGDQKASVEATMAECGTHGTHVAGIAAALANNDIGVAGAAPGANLYLVDLDYETRAGCPMDSVSLIRGIQHVVNGGNVRAEVMNLSLGTSTPLGQSTVDALQSARDAGIIIVGAAGNTACNNGQPTSNPVSYPAAYSQVWAVGATDRDDRRACYSHVGPELFIAAPGGDGFGPGGRFDTIYSTDFDFTGGNHVYGWMEGTSMAAPLVAGIVAQLKAAVPGATDAQIRQAIIDGARDLGASGKDNQFGHGLINAVAAYDALTGGSEPPPPPPPPPPAGVMRISFPDHPQYQSAELDPDGLFTILNVPTGPFRIVVQTDEDGDGVFGEPGEHHGEVTVNVRFDQANQAVVVLEQR